MYRIRQSAAPAPLKNSAVTERPAAGSSAEAPFQAASTGEPVAQASTETRPHWLQNLWSGGLRVPQVQSPARTTSEATSAIPVLAAPEHAAQLHIQTLIDGGSWTAALAAARCARTTHPTSMSLTLTHADLAWLLGNYEHAIQACNIVLAQSKHTNAVATRQHAFESKSIAMWLRGDVVGSSTCSQLALELDSSAPRSLLIAGLSQTVLRQNAPPSSYRLMTEALNSEEANTDPLILTVRGIMQTLQCSHDAAAALYDEALARAKGYPLAIAYRGLNALRGVLGGTARAELLAAVLESPYLHVHAIAFASLLFGSGDRACALQWAQRAVALEPHFAHAQFLLAVLTAQLGSEEAREESAEVLAGMDPSSPFTDLARATCALISHDLVAARRALDGAQAKKLASHFYLEEKVCLLWREGKTEDALLEVTAAVADGYISTNLLALQGLILSDLQRYDEAICVLTQAQARDDLRDDLRLALAAAQAAAAEGMRDFQQRENLFRRSLALMQRAFGGLPVTGAVRSQARLLVARSLNGLHLYDAALAAANEVQTLDGAALAAAIQMQQKDNAEKAG